MPRIGWRNPSMPGYNIVDSGNQASTSGRYFNDASFHASCTIQNIMDSQEDSALGASGFNTLLTDLKRSIVVSTFNTVFSQLELIESGLLFRYPNSYTLNTIPNTGKFCGFKIVVSNGSFAAQAVRANILLDGNATFKLYLFRDFRKAPLASVNVTAVAGEMVTVDLGQVFNYLNASNKGGAYYLGYFQHELGTAKAIDLSPSRNCFKVFRAESVITDATAPVVVPGDYTIDTVNYELGTQMRGLNLEMASYRDYTDDIVKGIHQFDELIGLQMAAKVIEMILNSNRSNKTERIQKANLSMLYQDLNTAIPTDNSPFVPGLKDKIAKEVKRVKNVFRQIPKHQTVDLL